MHVLVTGGAGYIGSHTVVTLIGAGHRVTVVDDLSNSSEESLRRVGELTGQPVAFHRLDVRDRRGLDEMFARAASSGHPVEAVIHFAGLKAVGESVVEPVRYYDVNVGSAVVLLAAMHDAGVRRIVFSSSATVYGDPVCVPIPEDAVVQPANPYGRTKAVIEGLLRDVAASGTGWQVSLLRYFNPVGAHPSGRIGEDPTGTPNNLLPFVAQVAVGRRREVAIFGDDYDTPDGTGVRDYIHVVDLALGHVAALDRPPAPGTPLVVNLGTGTGASVLEVIRTFSEVAGVPVPYRIAPRRPGDVAACYADVSVATEVLGWKAQRSLADACADTWRWQRSNPNGYR
ncbi:UDP-glucose 4-epimerase GalE [Acidiferrimicrobium sp. IK]|uniref:UDP-glucose 4-epimerase GalE n=1 Tax=Acidiferrimicrobium sp. IK TaxID=2871700 RepID=UPI0021CB9471|nr:UDP-glucose 4-epimerase GalE [Acidiferrimicrobium sp. IK]MCU4184261.1 UDP-glucose 4-epimerase GalE [Acidiferrimicrobium sp. IK]